MNMNSVSFNPVMLDSNMPSGGAGNSELKSLEQKLQQLNVEKQKAVQSKDKKKEEQIKKQIEKIQKQIQELKRTESKKEQKVEKTATNEREKGLGEHVDVYA